MRGNSRKVEPIDDDNHSSGRGNKDGDEPSSIGSKQSGSNPVLELLDIIKPSGGPKRLAPLDGQTSVVPTTAIAPFSTEQQHHYLSRERNESQKNNKGAERIASASTSIGRALPSKAARSSGGNDRTVRHAYMRHSISTVLVWDSSRHLPC